MNIVLFGATGTIGSRILEEVLSRGHNVTAVARDVTKVPTKPNLTARQANVLDPESVEQVAAGADAVISAFGPDHEHPEQLLRAVRALTAGLKKAGVRRLIVVGGAGSLEVAPGLQLVDSPNFPAAWKGVALAHRDALTALRESDLDWTSLSPAALIEPGERTGKFQLGGDQLITDSKGQSRISAEDFAIALADELEHPKHIRSRFTVAYTG